LIPDSRLPSIYAFRGAEIENALRFEERSGSI
jgi:superfamily I DNA/RNA helicase